MDRAMKLNIVHSPQVNVKASNAKERGKKMEEETCHQADSNPGRQVMTVSPM